MEIESAIAYLDKTLVLWKTMSYFEEEPKLVPSNLSEKDKVLMTKALEKFCRDGYMTEEKVVKSPTTTSRRFRVTFEGNFVLEKYNNRPYYYLAKKERGARIFEYAKIIGIIVNAIATLYLLAAQTFGWSFPLTQKPNPVNQIAAQSVTDNQASDQRNIERSGSGENVIKLNSNPQGQP